MLFRKRYPAIFSDPTLQKHPVFFGFTPGSLEDIAPFFSEESYSEGAAFSISTTENNRFIIVKSGELEIRETLKNDWGEEIRTLTPGQWAGAVNLLQSDFSRIACRTLTPVELISISEKQAVTLLNTGSRNTNRFFLNLCNVISEILEKLNRDFIQLYTQEVISGGNLKRRKTD
ncbi:cyclic nucleotide-binding domain-containing protein [candidate division KSB1 bacterium]